uniref:Uncharacterized protein n=1 Tax=Ixodes ricinus TaxID=34613 RepID=A0A6B0UUX3_IXORI
MFTWQIIKRMKEKKQKTFLLNELNLRGYKRTVVGNELRNQSAPERCWKECMQCIINILMKQATSRRCTQNSPGALKPGQLKTSFVVEKSEGNFAKCEGKEKKKRKLNEMNKDSKSPEMRLITAVGDKRMPLIRSSAIPVSIHKH